MTIQIVGLTAETLETIENGAHGNEILEQAEVISDAIQEEDGQTFAMEIEVSLLLFENDGAYIVTPDGLSFKLLDSEYRWICTQ